VIDTKTSRSADVNCVMLSDPELLEFAKRGQTEAFGELHRRHARRLLVTASKITNNREDSEDAVQDTFLKAFSRLDSFCGRSSFSTWLTSILINTCLMQLRKNRGYAFISLELPTSVGLSWKDALPDPRIDTEGELVLQQRTRLLAGAISKLRPNLRAVVETYQEHDCSLAEIAQRNQISCSAVKSRMLRAKAVLRASYRLKNAR
jgi:RNA polymerase sigma-70 factor, ECF subfamily